MRKTLENSAKERNAILLNDILAFDMKIPKKGYFEHFAITPNFQHRITVALLLNDKSNRVSSMSMRTRMHEATLSLINSAALKYSYGFDSK